MASSPDATSNHVLGSGTVEEVVSGTAPQRLTTTSSNVEVGLDRKTRSYCETCFLPKTVISFAWTHQQPTTGQIRPVLRPGFNGSECAGEDDTAHPFNGAGPESIQHFDRIYVLQLFGGTVSHRYIVYFERHFDLLRRRSSRKNHNTNGEPACWRRGVTAPPAVCATITHTR